MYYYSPSQNSFIPESLKQNYIDAGSFFEDAIEVEDDVWKEYSADTPPAGKIRKANKNGLPEWVDLPPLTTQELALQAEQQKLVLQQAAAAAIAPLERAVRLKMATEQETEQLTAWERYSVLLNRVDTATAPDIAWPEQPAI